MTLQLYHKRHKGIIQIDNVDSAKVVFGGYPHYAKRLRIISNGKAFMYQADLYLYRWL